MRHSILLPCCLIAGLASAQPQLPADTRAGIRELRTLALHQPDARKLAAELQGIHPAAWMGGRCMIGFLGKVNDQFDPGAVDPGKVHIGSRVGKVLSFRVDAYALDVLQEIPGLEYAELAGIARPTLDKLVKSIHADSVQQGIFLPQPYTGDGVLIGVLDWGFDYTHPMFYDTAMTHSRIRAAWDQFKQAGPAPDGFGYGAEYATPDALAAAQSDTANIYSYATHGSHVAGIAGGGGAGTIYRGIAFDAQFLFCTFQVDAAAAIDGVAWMKQLADQDGKRLVVNMSWGLYHMGTLDGTSLLSQAYDQLADEGVAICVSGGNNGDVNFHIGKEFNGDTLTSRVQFYPYSANPHMYGQGLIMWGTPGEPFSACLRVLYGNYNPHDTRWFHTGTEPALIDSILVLFNDTVFFQLTTDAAHPLNGRPHFRLRVKNTNTMLHVHLRATAPSGTVHFWNVTDLTNDVGNWGQAFLGGQAGMTAGDANFGIGEPACTEKVITVAACGSTTWSASGVPQEGNIASFSSFGPTLDGRNKPDITAPGLNVASSISSFTDNSYSTILNVPFQGRNYPFARFSGTSMSAPAATGTVALLLQAGPALTPAEIRDIIRNTALTDGKTGAIPPEGSLRWGMGKLNAYHAVAEVLGVSHVDGHFGHGVRLWPNPTAGRMLIQPPFDAIGGTLIVMDALGRAIFSLPVQESGPITVDASACPGGIYFVRMEKDGRRAIGRFVKE
ncbi:MAG: S8 family peptidase [Flavobacteriales bacterium]|nr:S8 family peptidase [Flavobacteriales bacterium]MEB2342704.1 S8 family peptidase [Flavobacteriia bacterium]